MKIKLAIVLLLCTACTVIPSCKTVSEKTAADSGTLFLINTVTPHEARSTVIPITESQASDADSIAVILTAPYINRYTLDGSLDFDAFVEYLSEYYTELYGDPLVICVTDMIDYGDSTDGRGVVTVLAEYHSYVSLESGRNADTLRGGCNFFFSYDVSSGADFSPRPFVEDTYLHSIKEAIGNDFSEYTATVDTRGYVQLVKAGHSVITTPAKFCWELGDFADLCKFRIDGDNIVLVIRENNGEYGDGDWTDVLAYASSDGGVTWTSYSLDYTPTTTSNIFEVTSLVLNMIDDMRGTAILSTPRCEVFFYVTEDGGVTWEKRRNFKLLNYRIDGLHAGGLIDDELGFISFIAREGENPNVYITYDGGRTWTLMDISAPDGISDAGAYADMAYIRNGTVVIPILYADGERNYISRDNGVTWEWDR
ncbi:MAG: exo-alpha-sialidase [Clostridia bacterium]|nr:exo-alpha-sialidase [Clostridia bacterium]